MEVYATYEEARFAYEEVKEACSNEGSGGVIYVGTEDHLSCPIEAADWETHPLFGNLL